MSIVRVWYFKIRKNPKTTTAGVKSSINELLQSLDPANEQPSLPESSSQLPDLFTQYMTDGDSTRSKCKDTTMASNCDKPTACSNITFTFCIRTTRVVKGKNDHYWTMEPRSSSSRICSLNIVYSAPK